MNLSNLEHEFYAINILEALIDDFPQMKKGESPDFYSDDKVGIEVTRALSSTEGEMDSFRNAFLSKSYSIIPKGKLMKLGFISDPKQEQTPNLNYLYSQYSEKHGKLLYFKDKFTGELILLAALEGKNQQSYKDAICTQVKTKLCKLNKNYSLKKQNNLLLIVEELLNYTDIQEYSITTALERCKEAIQEAYDSNDFQYRFDLIYALHPDYLLIINTKGWDSKAIMISEDILNSAIMKARNKQD